MNKGNFVKKVFVLFVAGIALDRFGQNIIWCAFVLLLLLGGGGSVEEKPGCGIKRFPGCCFWLNQQYFQQFKNWNALPKLLSIN